jgi:hypothetical protein
MRRTLPAPLLPHTLSVTVVHLHWRAGFAARSLRLHPDWKRCSRCNRAVCCNGVRRVSGADAELRDAIGDTAYDCFCLAHSGLREAGELLSGEARYQVCAVSCHPPLLCPQATFTRTRLRSVHVCDRRSGCGALKTTTARRRCPPSRTRRRPC